MEIFLSGEDKTFGRYLGTLIGYKDDDTFNFT